MKENLTHICCITDRSGSMATIKEEVIGGFNSLIEKQREEPGECTVTYVQFDNEYEIVFTDTALEQVPRLTSETFVPRGMTALLDAVGRTIVTTGARLAAMDEADRPGKVLCIIVTDGLETASHEFPPQQVRDMIKHQTDGYQWEFIYLGADDKAFQEAQSLGIKGGNVAKFAGTRLGAAAAYDIATRAVSSYRAGGDADNLIVNSVAEGSATAGDIEVHDDDADQN